jgi:antitoxin HicB
MGPAAEYGFTVIYEPLVEGGYGVVVPAIPEIVTFGPSLDEARAMAQDAIRCFIESALKTGEAIPADLPSVTTERVAITL